MTFTQARIEAMEHLLIALLKRNRENLDVEGILIDARNSIMMGERPSDPRDKAEVLSCFADFHSLLLKD